MKVSTLLQDQVKKLWKHVIRICRLKSSTSSKFFFENALQNMLNVDILFQLISNRVNYYGIHFRF